MKLNLKEKEQNLTEKQVNILDNIMTIVLTTINDYEATLTIKEVIAEIDKIFNFQKFSKYWTLKDIVIYKTLKLIK